MSTGRQWALIGAALAVLGGGLWFLTVQLGAELFPLKIGSEAPDFAAVTLPPRRMPAPVPGDTAGGATAGAAAPIPAPPAGETPAGITKGIDDYRGDVVLLNVWATWCAPCRVEMPSMERLQRQLGPKGLRIVAVSVDDPGMEGRITAFAEELGLTFELLHDAPGAIRTVYQTTGVPETFIIDRRGTIRRRIIGADDWSSPSNVAFLERLLAEPRP